MAKDTFFLPLGVEPLRPSAMIMFELCIRRPVLTIVLSLIVVLVGLICSQRLPVREYPKMDAPVVSITTAYGGASAAIMETEVTTVLEDALAGIEGTRKITSMSSEQTSQISVEFELSRDPNAAEAEVRTRVDRVRGKLPRDAGEPTVAKLEADAQPIIFLAFSSSRYTQLQITDYVDRYIKDEIQRIDGVAEAEIYGARRYAMRLWLDPMRLAAHDLTPQDVERALRNQNVEIPGGRIESRSREFTVLSETGLQTPEQFDNLVLKDADGHPVRLRDVGRAELGVQDDRSVAHYNGAPAVLVGLVRQSVANPLEIGRTLHALLPQIQARLLEGMEVDLTYDSTLFIDQSILNVYKAIVEAVILVIVVVFFFLRSFRSILIPIVAIPVSLIGTFAMMAALGFTINTLTLLALVLAIGLVVDDAIVVLENIFRHVEEGMPPLTAAFRGAREIGFAVVAMTLTLAAVYIPVAFTQGRTGRLFTEFALTLAGAVLISGFVALTLSPMMCSRMLRPEAKPEQPNKQPTLSLRAIERLLAAADRSYRRAVAAVLHNRGIVVMTGIFVLIGCVVVYQQLKSELAPLEDRGAFLATVIAPEGATVDYTAAYVRKLERIYADVPEVTWYLTMASGRQGGASFIGTVPWNERSRSTSEIAAALRPKMSAVPGVLAFPILPASLVGNAGGQSVRFVIRDSRPYAEIAASVDQIVAKMRGNPIFTNISTDLKINTPQLLVRVNRDRVADLGIDMAAIGQTINTMVSGEQATRFQRGGKQYDVILQTDPANRTTPEQLNWIFVRTPSGAMVPLSSLIDIQEIVAPRSLNHFNRARSVTITAGLTPGASLGEALAFLESTARQVLPDTATFDYDGQSREFRESTGALYVTFLLALGFIYLVLAVQFESFIDPLIILFTVPLSMLGALFALQLTGNTLNVYSEIGLITLIGLITKHGILITEFANQRQEAGVPKLQAVIEAAARRLRPILMTTAAMVLGAVPLALATGAGAESRHQIGWVIVGGLSLGTLLTLFVVPVAYSFLARDRSRHPSTRSAAALAPLSQAAE